MGSVDTDLISFPEIELELHGSDFYLVHDSYDRLTVSDVSDPANPVPQISGALGFPYFGDIAAETGNAVVAAAWECRGLIDTSLLQSPGVIMRSGIPVDGFAVDIQGEIVLGALGEAGLTIWKILDRAAHLPIVRD